MMNMATQLLVQRQAGPHRSLALPKRQISPFQTAIKRSVCRVSYMPTVEARWSPVDVTVTVAMPSLEPLSCRHYTASLVCLHPTRLSPTVNCSKSRRNISFDTFDKQTRDSNALKQVKRNSANSPQRCPNSPKLSELSSTFVSPL